MKFDRFPLKDCMGFPKYRYQGHFQIKSFLEELTTRFDGKITMFAQKLYIFKSKQLHITAPDSGNSMVVTFKQRDGVKEVFISEFESSLHKFLED